MAANRMLEAIAKIITRPGVAHALAHAATRPVATQDNPAPRATA